MLLGVVRAVALVACLAVAACATGPSEAQRDAVRRVQELTAAAEAGRLDWPTWARETEALLLVASGGQANTHLRAYLAYRHVIAADIASKKITPVEGKALMLQRQVELTEAEQRGAALDRSNRPTVCNRIGNTVTCS